MPKPVWVEKRTADALRYQQLNFRRETLLRQLTKSSPLFQDLVAVEREMSELAKVERRGLNGGSGQHDTWQIFRMDCATCGGKLTVVRRIAFGFLESRVLEACQVPECGYYQVRAIDNLDNLP